MRVSKINRLRTYHPLIHDAMPWITADELVAFSILSKTGETEGEFRIALRVDKTGQGLGTTFANLILANGFDQGYRTKQLSGLQPGITFVPVQSARTIYLVNLTWRRTCIKGVVFAERSDTRLQAHLVR